MSLPSPIPVVLFGKTEDAGAAVAALLQPEYEGLSTFTYCSFGIYFFLVSLFSQLREKKGS